MLPEIQKVVCSPLESVFFPNIAAWKSQGGCQPLPQCHSRDVVDTQEWLINREIQYAE